MKSILFASTAFLLASVAFAPLASAQMSPQASPQPYMSQPAPQPDMNQPNMAQPMAQPNMNQTNPGQTMPPQQTGLQPAPQGPYLASCKDARLLGGDLVAFCSKPDGTWHTSMLSQADQCAGNVQNINGDLTCPTGPQVGSTTPPQYYGSSYGTSGSPAYGTPPANQGYGNMSATTPPPAGGYNPTGANGMSGAYAPTYAPAPSPTNLPPGAGTTAPHSSY
jgi:hypothetical protein